MNDVGDKDFVLINMLTKEALNQAHIRTSITIPREEPGLEETVTKAAGDKDRDAVVYCASFDKGGRS